jgi:hypothetical protein
LGLRICETKAQEDIAGAIYSFGNELSVRCLVEAGPKRSFIGKEVDFVAGAVLPRKLPAFIEFEQPETGKPKDELFKTYVENLIYV